MASFREAEDRREIDRLILHSRFGLLGVTVVAVVATLTSDSAVVAAGALSAVLALHCDVLWDWRTVGHARNWFGRSTMKRTGSIRVSDIQVRWFWLWWPLFYTLALLPACFLYMRVGSGTGEVFQAYMLVFLPLSIILACFLAIIAVFIVVRSQTEESSRPLALVNESLRSYIDSAPTSELFYTKRNRIQGFASWVIVNHVVALLGTATAIALAVFGTVALLPPSVSAISIPIIEVELLNVIVVLAVLVISLLCGYYVHSTAGFLGGCLGAAMGCSLLLVVPSTRDILFENPTVMTAAMLAALVSWIGGLVFLRFPGARRTSASVLIVTPTDTMHLPQIIDDLSRLSSAELSLEAVARLGAVNEEPIILQPRLPYLFVSPRGSFSITRNGDTREVAVKFQPRALQLSVLRPTFSSVAIHHESQLSPRSNAAGESSAQPYVSEILDNILTNSAFIVVQIMARDSGEQTEVICRCFEQTTTKQYATTNSRSIIQGLAKRIVLEGQSLRHISLGDIENQRCPYPGEKNAGSALAGPDPALADLPSFTAEAKELGTTRRHATSRAGFTFIAQVASVAFAALRTADLLRHW